MDQDTVQAVKAWEAERACRRLMLEYARRIDHGQAQAVAELFTADGAWTSPTIEAVGTEALREFFARRDAMRSRVTRHVVVNIDIDLVDEDRARGRSVAIELRDDLPASGDGIVSDTRPAIVGDYEDEFVRVDGRWLFHRRNVVVAFKREGEVFLRQG